MFANDAPWNDKVKKYRRMLELDPDPYSTEPMKPSFISWKRRGFGRANLWAALFIHAFAVCLLFAGHWLAYLFAVVLPAVLWIASWIDWQRFLKIDHKHPNAHTEEVCEECDPIQMRDGGPVTNIVWWWAAKNGITRGLAEYHFANAATGAKERVAREHADYLAHPKFKNYPRP